MTDVTDSPITRCDRLREAALPSLGTHAARVRSGVAVGGDVIFGIDEPAGARLGDTELQAALVDCVQRGSASLRGQGV